MYPFLSVTLHVSRLVHNTFLGASALGWAWCLISVIARSCLLCFTFFVAEDCLIVAGDDLVDVFHTAIAQFDCIFIGDFVEFVCVFFFLWEAHSELIKELLLYFVEDAFAIWRIEPRTFLLILSLLISFISWSSIFLNGLMFSLTLFLVVSSLLSCTFSFLLYISTVYISSVSGRRCMVFMLPEIFRYWMGS